MTILKILGNFFSKYTNGDIAPLILTVLPHKTYKIVAHIAGTPPPLNQVVTNRLTWTVMALFSLQDFGINGTLSDRLEGMSAELLTPVASATKAEVKYCMSHKVL